MAMSTKRVPRIPTRNLEAGSADLVWPWDWDWDSDWADCCALSDSDMRWFTVHRLAVQPVHVVVLC